MDGSCKYDLIGIDGGGTSCRIALLHDGSRTEFECGSANVSTDLDAAVRMIIAGLEGVAQKAGVSVARISRAHAYLGLAGVTGPAIADKVAAGLPLDRCMVEEDRTAAIVGALGDEDGSLAAIGTGSFFARRSGGEIQAIGGWGLVLGDEASGAWLGRGILSRTLRAIDGLAPPTPLTSAVLDTFKNDRSALIAFSLTATPREFAEYARPVIGATRQMDPAAIDLMNAGADYIGHCIRSLKWRSDENLCLIGGIAPHYRAFLDQSLAAAIVEPKGQALDGALALAERMRKSGTGQPA